MPPGAWAASGPACPSSATTSGSSSTRPARHGAPPAGRCPARFPCQPAGDPAKGSDNHDRPHRHQRLRPHRPQLPARPPGTRDLQHRGGRRQRHRPGLHPRPPAGVRLHLRPAPGPGHPRRPQLHRGRPPHRGDRAPRPRRSRLVRVRRGHRDRVHRTSAHPRGGRRSFEGRRQEGPAVRTGQGRRRHPRDGRQPRLIRPEAARHRLQRVLHDELRGADGQGAAGPVRHRKRPDDDHPRIHQRPVVARRPPQGPAARQIRCPEHDPYQHRRRPRRGPGAARTRRNAGRHRRPGTGRGRLPHRPDRPARPRDLHRRGERRLRAGGGRPAHRDPARQHRTHRLPRRDRRPGILRHRRTPDPGPRPPGENLRLVRQRMGLQQPPARPHAVRWNPPVTNDLRYASGGPPRSGRAS
ncbi:NAD-dependent glyceraldehyde-3-phosphate dehydrogenase [Actinacidiphila bryophytorum]|uniref:NAD-dependent glyceraldehyde-3-phosphate dehydrogenase n=1 Tax=Actinacidiphila bryophytorum TaxID=1436133 RepID=A0A9W4E2B7_9ACTN|nr:NAD-dependent glyceraldehyde-3-phosphate dehydrogenase [Actinacidiphila bryophytorum]